MIQATDVERDHDHRCAGVLDGPRQRCGPGSLSDLRSPSGSLRVLARRLRRTNNLADLILTDVPGRVAKQLLALAQRFGTQDDDLRVTHDLTQVEIAQLVGASRETVNKALADFAHRGWIRLEGKSADLRLRTPRPPRQVTNALPQRVRTFVLTTDTERPWSPRG